MRHSVLAGVLQVTAANLRHTNDVRLFEIGSVYLPEKGEKLPREPRRLALVMTGRRRAEFWAEPDAGSVPMLDFFDMKGVIEALVWDLHLADVAYRPAEVSYLHPGKAGELLAGGNVVGQFGVLHPKVAEAYELGGRDVLAGEFDLEAILAAVPERHAYVPVPRFPAALRDIAVIVDEPGKADLKFIEDDFLHGRRLDPARRAFVRPLPRREHSRRQEKPGLRAHLSERRADTGRQGSGQGAQED